MVGPTEPSILKAYGVFMASIAIWFLVLLGLAIRRGELRLRAGPVNRAKEPWQFWFFVVVLGWVFAFIFFLGAGAFSPSAKALALALLRPVGWALSGWIDLFVR